MEKIVQTSLNSQLNFIISLSISNIAESYYESSFITGLFEALKDLHINDAELVEVLSEYIASSAISYQVLAKNRDLSNKRDLKAREQIDKALTLFSFIESYSITNPKLKEISGDSVRIEAEISIHHAGRLKPEHIDFQKNIILLTKDSELFRISKNLHDHKKLYWFIIGNLFKEVHHQNFIERSKFFNEISMSILIPSSHE